METCKIHGRLRCAECAYVEELKSKVEEMQKTLEWYADAENYEAYTHNLRVILMDNGEHARQALKGVKPFEPTITNHSSSK